MRALRNEQGTLVTWVFLLLVIHCALGDNDTDHVFYTVEFDGIQRLNIPYKADEIEARVANKVFFLPENKNAFVSNNYYSSLALSVHSYGAM